MLEVPSPKRMFSLEIDGPIDEECRAWLEHVADIIERDIERLQRDVDRFGAGVIGKAPDAETPGAEG